MVNFENAKQDGNEKLAIATLETLRDRVRAYATANPGTPEEIAARLEAPQMRTGPNGEPEQCPGLFYHMILGLPYAANSITPADVEEAIKSNEAKR